jgi:hypothetical protein
VEMLVILKRKQEVSPHQRDALRYLAQGGGQNRRVPRGITIPILNGLALETRDRGNPKLWGKPWGNGEMASKPLTELYFW